MYTAGYYELVASNMHRRTHPENLGVIVDRWLRRRDPGCRLNNSNNILASSTSVEYVCTSLVVNNYCSFWSTDRIIEHTQTDKRTHEHHVAEGEKLDRNLFCTGAHVIPTRTNVSGPFSPGPSPNGEAYVVTNARKLTGVKISSLKTKYRNHEDLPDRHPLRPCRFRHGLRAREG